VGRKVDVQETVNNILIFAKQILRPRQSGAHGTFHACHTLETALSMSYCIFGHNFLKNRSVWPFFIKILAKS